MIIFSRRYSSSIEITSLGLFRQLSKRTQSLSCLLVLAVNAENGYRHEWLEVPQLGLVSAVRKRQILRKVHCEDESVTSSLSRWY